MQPIPKALSRYGIGKQSGVATSNSHLQMNSVVPVEMIPHLWIAWGAGLGFTHGIRCRRIAARRKAHRVSSHPCCISWWLCQAKNQKKKTFKAIFVFGCLKAPFHTIELVYSRAIVLLPVPDTPQNVNKKRAADTSTSLLSSSLEGQAK